MLAGNGAGNYYSCDAAISANIVIFIATTLHILYRSLQTTCVGADDYFDREVPMKEGKDEYDAGLPTLRGLVAH